MGDELRRKMEGLRVWAAKDDNGAKVPVISDVGVPFEEDLGKLTPKPLRTTPLELLPRSLERLQQGQKNAVQISDGASTCPPAETRILELALRCEIPSSACT